MSKSQKNLIFLVILCGGILGAASLLYMHNRAPTFEHAQAEFEQEASSHHELESMWCDAFMKRKQRTKKDLITCVRFKTQRYKDLEELGKAQYITLLTRRLKRCKHYSKCAKKTYDSAKKFTTPEPMSSAQQSVINKRVDPLGVHTPEVLKSAMPAEIQSIFAAHVTSLHTTCPSTCGVTALKLGDAWNVRSALRAQTEKKLAAELVTRWTALEISSSDSLTAGIRQLDDFSTDINKTLYSRLNKTQRTPIERDPQLAGLRRGVSVLRTALAHVPWMLAPWSYVKVSMGLRDVSFEDQDGDMLRMLLNKKGLPIVALKTHEEAVVAAMGLVPNESSTLPADAKNAFLSQMHPSPKEVATQGTRLVTKGLDPSTQASLATWAANHVAMREVLVTRIDEYLSPTYIPSHTRWGHRRKMLASFDTSYYDLVFIKHFARGVALTRPNKPSWSSSSSRSSRSSRSTSGVGYVPSSRRSVRSYSPTTRRSSYSSGGYRSGKN